MIYPICSVVAAFKMLVRILNALRSRIWDISFFLFNPNPQFRNMEYARRKFYCRGWQKKKNVKMGRCNLKYNVLAEEVCHALYDVHLVARMSGHS
uniref:hypothetical protein n=1 Tax=Anaerobutyricum hallii TaxID=39488 RepID=UPI003FF11332